MVGTEDGDTDVNVVGVSVMEVGIVTAVGDMVGSAVGKESVGATVGSVVGIDIIPSSLIRFLWDSFDLHSFAKMKK